MNTSYSEIIKAAILEIPQNQVVVANQLHIEKLSNVPETAYYKNLERLVKRGELVHVGKGIYSKSRKTRFGNTGASESDIINYFTSDAGGLIVGYRLFNKLGLTTQISKRTEIKSTRINGACKKIGNISIVRINTKLSDTAIKQIEALEVLENYSSIENIDNQAFISYSKNVAENFDEKVFDGVIETVHYKKQTIAFYAKILDTFNVPNKVCRYLSPVSKYKIPEEGIFYEASRKSR